MSITLHHSVTVSQTENRLEVVGFGHVLLAGCFENLSLCISPHFPTVIKNRRNWYKRKMTTYIALPCQNESEKELVLYEMANCG